MSNYDLAIDLDGLVSHAGEVDNCANTLDACYDTATQTLGQVITNAFGLMFMQYTAVCTYQFSNIAAMINDAAQAEHRLSNCLIDLEQRMREAERGNEDLVRGPGNQLEPCPTPPGSGDTPGTPPGSLAPGASAPVTGPSGGTADGGVATPSHGGGGGVSSGGGGGVSNGGVSGTATMPKPNNAEDIIKGLEKDKKDDETSIASMLAGHDKVCVGEDELRAFLEKQRGEENADLKTFYDRQKEDQAKALERYAEAHPGEDISEVKTLIEDNQKQQQDAMTDFLAKQRTEEEAQIREFVKDNPTATTQQFDTFMSKQRNEQQTSFRAFVDEQQKTQNARIDEFSKAHPESKPEDVRSLFEKQDKHGDQDIETFLTRQRQDEERTLRRFIFEGVKK